MSTAATAIDLANLVQILGSHVEGEKKKAILEDIKKLLEEEQQEKEKAPKIPKKKIIILTAIPKGMTERDISELAGFITEIPEEDPTRNLIGGLKDVKVQYNESRKARKNPANSLGELFEFAPLKMFKEENIFKKPAGPLEFIHIPNR